MDICDVETGCQMTKTDSYGEGKSLHIHHNQTQFKLNTDKSFDSLSAANAVGSNNTELNNKNTTYATIDAVQSSQTENKIIFCSLCDPLSSLEHTIQISRLRVANLCCAGEEKLMMTALKEMVGIEHVAVNIIGRYAIIKHCTVECCAPIKVIMDKLNDLHLGVSVQEVAMKGEEETEPLFQTIPTLHVLIVFFLFAVGLILHLLPGFKAVSDWIYIACTILGALPIIRNTAISLFIRRMIDIQFLILVAIIGAMSTAEYFDSSLVVTLFLMAELIEHVVMGQVRRAVSKSTAGTMPKEAYLTNGKAIKVQDIKIGDKLAVRAGEVILADGKVIKGDGVADESAVTGEAMPVSKIKGSAVISGTIMQNGYLEFEVTKPAQESTVNKLHQAVLDVQADKAECSKWIDVFSLYWTPLVLVSALLLVVIGGGVSGDWDLFLFRGLVLLVLACPCAVVISAPIPFTCAIATAAKRGVLIRGSSVIERIAAVRSIAVDKTGTLTKGFFQVSDRLQLQDEYDDGVDPLLFAASIEQKSTHPLANAIVSAYCGCIAEAASTPFPEVRKIKILEGVGIEGWVAVEDDWKYVMVGNERLLCTNGGKVRLSESQMDSYRDFCSRNSSQVVLLIAVDDSPLLLLSLADEVRPESALFVQEMRRMGLPVSILTGDQPAVTATVAKVVGIAEEDCNSALLPTGKLQWIDNQQKVKQSPVLMIGDGINDSIALTAASVGVAMGAGGTAMAVSSASVVLMTDNLKLIAPTIQIAKLSMNIMMQNCFFAITVKVVAIGLAVTGRMNLWQAILIDLGTLLVVAVNSLRTLQGKFS